MTTTQKVLTLLRSGLTLAAIGVVLNLSPAQVRSALLTPTA